MDMRIPQVQICEVVECGYNADRRCHAVAIQVGDQHPSCDTFTPNAAGMGADDQIAAVGACKVSQCSFNENLLCQAADIVVAHHRGHADCVTFRPR